MKITYQFRRCGEKRARVKAALHDGALRVYLVNMTLQVLFENDDILAVNKPEGISSIPGHTKGETTLVSLVTEASGLKPYVVHRLDKEVSGVMLFAKNARTHKYLNEQFGNRTIKKTYLALVHGTIKDEKGIIDAAIRQCGSGRMAVDAKNGKPSQTEYETVRRYGKYTLVKVFPLTGRRHQIRVHLYSIGHPVAGDTRYGDRAVQKQFGRLMLHSRRISFYLPSGEKISVEAQPPQSFNQGVEGICDGR